MKWTLRCSLEDLGRVDPRIFYIGFLSKIVINFCIFSAGWALDHRDSLRNLNDPKSLRDHQCIDALYFYMKYLYFRAEREENFLKIGTSSFEKWNIILTSSKREFLRWQQRLKKLAKKLVETPKSSPKKIRNETPTQNSNILKSPRGCTQHA